MTDTVISATGVRVAERAVLGTSPTRPDAVPKVQGRFAFSSDLWADGMVWGKTLRSPHPHARIRRLDVSPAWRIPGVEVVVTAEDVPGATYGLITSDQPVFASDTVLYAGQAVAAVAADHPETARRACEAIIVEYEVLEPLTDPESAIEAPPIHPDGNVFRHQRIERGDASAVGDVVVEGTYDIGMQDQAFLGLESALAIPDHDGGGVELFISTQWLHEDRRQIAECLGLPEERVRLQLSGVGGAFGAARGRQPPGARVPVGAASRPPRQDDVRPRRVVPRPRAQAPGHDLDAPPRPFRRDAGQPRVSGSARRRRVRVDLQRGAHQRDHARTGAVPVAERDGGWMGDAHEQPAVRRDARLRRAASVLRAREPDGPARRDSRTGPRRDPAAERHRDWRSAHHGAAARERGADGPVPAGDSRAPPPSSRRRRSMAGAPGWRWAHRRRGERAARRRLRAGDQEPDVLRGVRRLVDGAVPAGGRRRHAQARNRGSRSGVRHARRADRPRRARRRRGDARAGRHIDRISRIHLGVAADMDVGRGGRHGVPGGARASLRARRPRFPGRFDPARGRRDRHRRHHLRRAHQRRRRDGGQAVRGDRHLPASPH